MQGMPNKSRSVDVERGVHTLAKNITHMGTITLKIKSQSQGSFSLFCCFCALLPHNLTFLALTFNQYFIHLLLSNI